MKVLDFIEESLGEEGLKSQLSFAQLKTTLLFVWKGLVGTAVAEYFRDQGKNVLFMMDSVTRFQWLNVKLVWLQVSRLQLKASRLRFLLLPRLMEQKPGTSEKGSITAIYTVLVDGAILTKPLLTPQEVY